MYQRHDEVPFLVERITAMEALYFNRAKLALNRLNSQLRLPIPGLKTLDLIVQENAWIVVDRAFNDVPVIAWSDFDADTRDTLHQPIRCRLRLYHAHASIILGRVLKAMDELLDQRLHQTEAASGSGILVFPGPG